MASVNFTLTDEKRVDCSNALTRWMSGSTGVQSDSLEL